MTLVKFEAEVAVLEDSARKVFELPVTDEASGRTVIPDNFLRLSDSGLAIEYSRREDFMGKRNRQWIPVSQLEVHRDGCFIRYSVPNWLYRKIL